MEINYNEESVI